MISDRWYLARIKIGDVGRYLPLRESLSIGKIPNKF
jgi:hypothetical protein